MYGVMFIFFIAKSQATIQLGRIQNANWILNLSQIDNQYINISNTTCDECLCRMLTMNNLTTSIACQQKWMTCQLLFWNATAQLQTDDDSVVYFQTIPVFLLTTVDQQPMTTSITSMVSTAVTTETITTSAAITSMYNPSTFITTISTTKTSTTMTTTTTTGVPVWLINPGGELGSLNPWISSSSYAPVLDNGTANGANIPPYNGSFDFSGGPGGGSLNQKVSLTDKFSTTKLDSGLLYASISFWERTSIVSAADTGQVTLIFLSATNTSLSNVTTGPKTCPLAWCHVTGNWTLPIGTRTIDYVMIFVANYGSYADAWIDDNSLNVA